MDPREQPESLMASIRPHRRRSMLAGIGDRSGPWAVPVSLGLLALALVSTFFYLPHWHYLAAGALLLVGAGTSHFALRRDHDLSLPAGLVAVGACVVALVLFAIAPH